MTERNISAALAICSTLLMVFLLPGISGIASGSNTQTPVGGIYPDGVEHQGGVNTISAEKTVSAIIWESKAPMPTPRGQMAIVTGDDGLTYAMGGLDKGWNELDTNEAYDPVTDTWITKAPLPVRTRGAAHAKGPDGKIYLFGGCCGSIYNLTQIYDPVTDTWGLGAPLPSNAVWYAAAATGDDGKIYVIGGESDSGPYMQLDRVQIYDPASNTWSLGAPMPTPRLGLGVVKNNGLIYAIGGFDRRVFSVVNTVEAYDPVSNTWSKKSPLNTARFEFASALALGGINAIGGSNGTYNSTNEKGSPPDGRIWVMGGSSVYYNNNPPYFSSVEIYDSATDTWSYGTDLPAGRRELEADTPITAAPSVLVTTDRKRYYPGDMMQVTLNISNPTGNPVTFEWYIGVPQSGKWVTKAKNSIPPGYDETLSIPILVGNWGPSPLGLVHYTHLLEPVTGEVLAQDSAVFSYSPGTASSAQQVDIAEDLMKQE